jgi:hypothetical protein
MRRLQAGTRVAIPVEPETLYQRLPDLPAGVGLSPGALHIQFESSEELLSKLFALAQAIANDYEAFEKRVGQPATSAAELLARPSKADC